ncbi:Arc family DNA-binding protein [Providencia sneebia]|uniref:Regulatory protein Mnt n=1 Tax=Providencia sneebia DSM 19967 TaxID=1141660 RepID=K8WV81_9GAMM|nr:Arc family DNA-binding protein [Providencia sneebia]EKT61322.1 regulatory protein Mnt [Providencia sneebia DSM 19967]
MSRTTPVFNLRMPAELKEKISALADTNKRSINAEIIAAIELALSLNGNDLKLDGSNLPGGFGHLLKGFKPNEIEKLVNDISNSAAERAIKRLTEKKS